MSLTNQIGEIDSADCLQHLCATLELIIQPRERDLGGFSVRRVLPCAKRRMVGPWIFFDHMGPAVFQAGSGVDVRPHPHINLATVTYLFEGEIVHRDSLGSVQAIRPGDINLMVAGKGIVHSEREAPQVRKQARTVHGLQLWLALPKGQEEIEPVFYHYPSAEIPRIEVEGVPVRVMIGAAFGVTSPVRIYADTLYAEARLSKGQCIIIPDTVAERAVYVVQGCMQERNIEITEHSMAVLASQTAVTLTAREETHIAIIGGEPLGERHIWWNFVSSRKDRIEQAKLDWQAGRYPKVAGDEVEFIPLPE